MALDSADEKFIAELYRYYQHSRDNINQTALFGIKKSARAYLDELDPVEPVSEYGQTVMTRIRFEAQQKYLQTSGVSVAQGTGKNGFFERLRQAVGQFVNDLSRPVWAGAAVAAVLLLVININVFTPQSTLPTDVTQGFSSTVLDQNAEFVADEVTTTVDWQYGFSPQVLSAREAFVSGVYAVDLINLSQSPEIKNIAEQLSAMEALEGDQIIQSLLTSLAESESGGDNRVKLFTALADFYQTQPQVELFEFGRWLEFNYLHVKLALAHNDLSLYSEHRKPGQPVLERFISSGMVPEVISQDLDQLMLLSSETQLDRKNIEQQAKLLEKMRTLLF